MAQTKRKRRSKHRGTAAGVVEARGRTGRKPKPEELRKAQAQQRRRERRPATWNAAFLKAALMAGALFALFQIGLLGADATLLQSIVLCVLALLLYTPAAYYTDRLVYNWQQKRDGQQQKR